MKRFAATFLALFSCLLILAQNVELNIVNVKNKKGHIQIMVFKDSESYKADNPIQILRFTKTAVKDACMKIFIRIPKGEYGLILLDDENDSGEMEYNILGLPKEGFGFAGYYHRGIRRPDFEKFKFTVAEEKIQKEIRVRYF